MTFTVSIKISMATLPSITSFSLPPLPFPLSKPSHIHLLLLLLHIFTIFPFLSSSSNISYTNHCNSIVPPSTPSNLPIHTPKSFSITNGYFEGGDSLLGHNPNADFPIPKSFSFYERSILLTQTPGTFQIFGTLTFRGGGIRFSHRNFTRGRSLRLVRPLNPRSFNQWGRIIFDLSGFWSEKTGELCMVGTGSGRSKDGILLNLSALFKLKYPSSANITSSVVIGYLESLELGDSINYFERIMVMAYAQRNYEYSKVFDAQNSCPSLQNSEAIGLFDRKQSICDDSDYLLHRSFILESGNWCYNKKCDPLFNSSGFQPGLLQITSLDCDEHENFRMVVLFSNYSGFSSRMIVEPGMSMVAEGSWVQTKNQLCLVACRVKAITDVFVDNVVDDCTIGISLAFPAVLTIENRSTSVGRIWSNLNETSPGYFNSRVFQSLENNQQYDNSLRYEYTKIDAVRRSCTDGEVHKIGKKRYPDPRNFRDFMFYLVVKSEGKMGNGFANPLALDEIIYDYRSMENHALVENNESIWNISYSLKLTYHQNASFNAPDAEDISAEGIYNSKTGMICMVGCRSFSFDQQRKNLDSKDCSVFINIHVPPLNPVPGEHLNGTIRSTRENSDPLFFEPIMISSHIMYGGQASQSVWRMDIEITMILISLTFSCIFVCLQLHHSKKHPSVLSSVSIAMLGLLTLGHMIVLVLNFEAFWINHKNQNVLLGSSGWLEVNEVLVRLMTMVAFLLHFRLLQVVWSARSANVGKNSLWLAERKTIKLCLLIYIIGGCIAWLVHLRSQKTLHKVPHIIVETPHSHWENMQSYAGLILDGFLFPQVILNALCDSKEASLSPTFYIGTTILRALPHVFDAYLSRHYIPYLYSFYIYARPDSDIYSLACDIVIPCGGILFAIVLFIQQRFGGASIFCRKIEGPGLYEMVPVASS